MKLMMEATEARWGKFGIKTKNKDAVAAIGPLAKEAGMDLCMLGDFYPSGDEYELVYSATGRLIPAAGIPLNVGCVVNNVETLYNVHRAAEGEPVTRKFLTVCGAVKKPISFWAPIGTSFRDLIAMAGGATPAEIGDVCERVDDGHAVVRPGRCSDQDDCWADHSARGPHAGGAARAPERSDDTTSASRRATSAATAQNSVPAICWGTTCSRTK